MVNASNIFAFIDNFDLYKMATLATKAKLKSE